MSEPATKYQFPPYQPPMRYAPPAAAEQEPVQQLPEQLPTSQQIQQYAQLMCPITTHNCKTVNCAWFKVWSSHSGTVGMCCLVDISKALRSIAYVVDQKS